MVNESLDAANAIEAKQNQLEGFANIVVERFIRRCCDPDWRAPNSEKAPVDDRSPSRSKNQYAELLQGAGNAAEGGLQVRAEALHDCDDRNRNARGDQTIFNGRRTRLILHKTRN